MSLIKTFVIRDVAIIIGAILSLTGFYFSTSIRLTQVEDDVAELQSEVENNEATLQEVKVGIARIETKISGIEVVLTNIQQTLRDKEEH